jgi:hypothetical protein
MGIITVSGAKPADVPAGRVGRVEILVEAAFATLLDQRRWCASNDPPSSTPDVHWTFPYCFRESIPLRMVRSVPCFFVGEIRKYT